MSTQLLPRSIFFSVQYFLWCYCISALHTFRLFAYLLVKKLGFFYSPLFSYLLHRAMAFLPSIYPCILQIFSGLPNKTACLCKMVFQCCSPKSVEHARNKKGYRSPLSELAPLPVFPLSFTSFLWVGQTDDFFNGCAETKRLFSSKAEVSRATNVSWNAGNVWQGVKQLPWEQFVLRRKGQCTSSECIRSNKPGQMPKGLRLSAHKELLRSWQVSKWRMAKALSEGNYIWWPAHKSIPL